MAVRIADLPEPERPRERLVRVGPGALSDSELIALVLRTGGRGANAVEVGASLIAAWGSAFALASARFEDLLRIPALGEAKAASLIAAFELGRRGTVSVEGARPIKVPHDLVEFVRPLLMGKPHEEVLVVVMNSANKPTRTVSLTRGGADQCLLPVRDCISAVLRNDGVAFALAHNHPSGDPTPSREDIRATKDIELGAAGLGLRLVDHLIVAGAEWQSLDELGYLGQLRNANQKAAYKTGLSNSATDKS